MTSFSCHTAASPLYLPSTTPYHLPLPTSLLIPPPISVIMAVSKVLLVTTLLAMVLVLPAASTAHPIDRAVVSDLTDAPGLSGLVRATKACSYFKCGTKKVEVTAKHSFPCWFKVASAPRVIGPNECSPTPYDCVDDESCTGWKRCKCDACKKVELPTDEYCEKPASGDASDED